jgi:hypothetical protein
VHRHGGNLWDLAGGRWTSWSEVFSDLAVVVPFWAVWEGAAYGVHAHGYQGWRNVVVISVLGVLFGVLAAWRKNLRANMVVHAWADVWEGWLKFVVFR